MRIVTYEWNDGSRCGLVVGDRVVPADELAAAIGRPGCGASARRLLAGGPDTWRDFGDAATSAVEAGEGIAIDDLVLRAPIEDPDKIVCLGLNYRDHAEESGMDLPATPMLFAKFRNSLVGPAAAIVPPASAQAVDYEAELAVVIGRRAKDVAAAEAMDHVAGVMAMNDVTARDIQHATSQWTAGKAIDTFAPCGPSLVFLDEIDDVQDLGVKARLNGEAVQDGTTANMIFDVAATVEFVSSLMTLEPGDIIATGTPAGVGVSRDPQLLLRPGDVIEVEVGGVGTLRNVVAEPGAGSRIVQTAAVAASTEEE